MNDHLLVFNKNLILFAYAVNIILGKICSLQALCCRVLFMIACLMCNWLRILRMDMATCNCKVFVCGLIKFIMFEELYFVCHVCGVCHKRDKS